MPDSPELVLVDSFDEAEAFVRWLGERRPILGVDLETGGASLKDAALSPYHGRIRLAQFGDPRTGWAIPYDEWKGLVRHALDVYDRPMVAHNMKFDASFLEADGLTVKRELWHDTMLMCHLFDSHGPKALKPAATLYVAPWASAGQAELRSAMHRSKWTWDTVPTGFPAYWMYAALDTSITAMLAEELWPRIQDARDAYELELAVTWVILDMEARGMHIDVPYVVEAREVLAAELKDITDRYPDTNLLASRAVITALQAEGATFVKRTPKGNISLDNEALELIDHPLARDTTRARYLTKVIGTWFDEMLTWQVDGVLHPNVRTLGAEKTGRMSITRPAAQTFPRKPLVRDALIPREGNQLILADYSGQEMRVFAHYAGETAMLEAMRNGIDMHTFTAMSVYGVEVPSKAQRQIGKGANFAKVYGAGIAKFAEQMGITYAEAEAFLRKYDMMFPGVTKFQSRVISTIHKRKVNGFGYVISLGGRRIVVPVDMAYKGVNYLIQGSCADITKQAMVRADRLGIGQFLILPVHDELIWDVPRDMVEDVIPLIHEAMERTDLRVPLPVDIKVVDRWGDAYREAA